MGSKASIVVEEERIRRGTPASAEEVDEFLNEVQT